MAPLSSIDWSTVNWVLVALLSLFVFVAALIGNLLSFNRRLIGAVLAAILFAVFYIAWTYYPHGLALPT
jgi:hypothetical protein